MPENSARHTARLMLLERALADTRVRVRAALAEYVASTGDVADRLADALAAIDRQLMVLPPNNQD